MIGKKSDTSLTRLIRKLGAIKFCDSCAHSSENVNLWARKRRFHMYPLSHIHRPPLSWPTRRRIFFFPTWKLYKDPIWDFWSASATLSGYNVSRGQTEGSYIILLWEGENWILSGLPSKSVALSFTSPVETGRCWERISGESHTRKDSRVGDVKINEHMDEKTPWSCEGTSGKWRRTNLGETLVKARATPHGATCLSLVVFFCVFF